MGDPRTQCLPPAGRGGCSEAEIDSGETQSSIAPVPSATAPQAEPLPILTAGLTIPHLGLFPLPIQSLYASTAVPGMNHLRAVVPLSRPREPESLRVMTVNAYLYETPSWKKIFFGTPDAEKRVRQLAAFIARENPDVVLLQEIWQRRWFEALVDGLFKEGYFNEQLACGRTRQEIEDRLTLFFSDLGEGNTDLAIVSKHPLSNAEFTPFRWQGSTKVECGRRLADEGFVSGVGRVQATVDGQRFLLANIHPMHRREDEDDARKHKAEFSPERATQLLEAWEILYPELDRQPVILAGDFNFNLSQWEYTNVFRPLFGGPAVSDDLLGPSPQSAGLCTYCSGSPFHPDEGGEGIIDHVFVNDRLLLRRAQILTPRPAFTDHEIVVADVSFKKPADRDQRSPGAAERPRLPVKSYLKRVPVTPDLIKSLIAYFKDVSFHAYCLLTDFDDDRADQAIAFLEQLETEPPPAPNTVIARESVHNPAVLTSTSPGH